MIEEYFEEVRDPRQEWKVKHNLYEILIMTICAVVGGAEYWEDISDYCREKRSWFQERLGLKLQNGVASHDTFQRVFALLSPAALENCFESWTKAIHVRTAGEVISIDGKTLRGSKGGEMPFVHMVSAWANTNQMVLGQVATDAKSNEITAIPKLLEMLDVHGCIVTIDAMGCQKEIADKIIARGADYVLSLKENQPSLLEDVRLYFQDETLQRQQTITMEKDHGRIEKRAYYLTSDIQWLQQRKEWPGIHAIGMVRSTVHTAENTSEETRYFITSLSDVKGFAHAARSHWGIENSLHWCLDVVFHEDANRTRTDNSAFNFSVIRRIALNLLKSFPAQMSLRRKRFNCQINSDFLAQVLFSS
jgi:predicted transposase YbfD/YdcC